MPDSSSLDYEPGVLRVLQSKRETKAFYDKIAKVYDLLAEHSERPSIVAMPKAFLAVMVRWTGLSWFSVKWKRRSAG